MNSKQRGMVTDSMMIILAFVAVVVGLLMVCGPMTLANILNVIGNLTIMNKSYGFIIISLFFVMFVVYTRFKKRIKIIDYIAIIFGVFAILWILLFFFSGNIAILAGNFDVWQDTNSVQLKIVKIIGAILIAFGTGCGIGTIFNSSSKSAPKEESKKKE